VRAQALRRLTRALVAAGGLAAFAAGLVALAGHFGLFFARAGFALDLEWMEGGLLHHAARYAAGQNIYVPPSVDFVPYLYTPLYPALLALLSKLLPLGYLLGRSLSIAAFAAALGLLLVAALRAAREAAVDAPGSARGFLAAFTAPAGLAGLAVGLGGAGVVAASFAATGGFYDLVRADSLVLALEAGALVLALRALAGAGARAYRTAAAAGLLIALAFFTKQTASLVGVALGLGLLLAGWRRGLVYGAAAAVTLGAGLLLLELTSQGWFWTYVFKLHQSHEFYPRRAYLETPLHLLKLAGPLYLAWLLAGLALLARRRLRRADAVHVAVALGGFASACIGFGTQWAFDNAFIPAIYFPAVSAAIWTARLAALALADHLLSAAVAAVAGVALAVQAARTGLPDRRRFVPDRQDRAAAQRFLAHLRTLPGPLFIPFHPYYPVLVGQPAHVHRMGVWDVSALLGRPAGLDQALAEGRFSHVVLDYKSQPWEWPTLAERYHDVHRFTDGVDAVRSFSGAETAPRRLLARTTPPPPLPAGGVRLHDFESGYAGFRPGGTAFGAGPATAPAGLFGRFAADSRPAGGPATGTLTAQVAITHPRLRFALTGDADPALRVQLIDGGQASHSASPRGDGVQTVEWDVSRLTGRGVTLVIEDGSSTGGLAVDEIVTF
jgi:hypothetical protein